MSNDEVVTQIVGCYSLDLYCGNPKCDRREPLNNTPWNFPDQYTGNNRRECLHEAKAAGWKIRGDKATCPHCAKRRIP